MLGGKPENVGARGEKVILQAETTNVGCLLLAHVAVANLTRIQRQRSVNEVVGPCQTVGKAYHAEGLQKCGWSGRRRTLSRETIGSSPRGRVGNTS